MGIVLVIKTSTLLMIFNLCYTREFWRLPLVDPGLTYIPTKAKEGGDPDLMSKRELQELLQSNNHILPKLRLYAFKMQQAATVPHKK